MQNADFTVGAANGAHAWDHDAGPAQFGSAFRYVQPFSVRGDAGALVFVAVPLINDQGESQTVTVNF